MNLKIVLLLAGFACLAPMGSPAQPIFTSLNEDNVAEAESVYTMRARGELAFDTQGKVVSHSYSTKLEPAVAASIDRAIKSWRFQPYLKDGVPVNVRTPFEVTLAGRELSSGQFEVNIESSRFGAAATPCENRVECNRNSAMENRPKLPGFPRGMMTNGVSGMVLVYLKLDAKGQMVDATVAQSALFNVKGNKDVLAKVRRYMERECLIYSRKAKWKAGTGDPVPGSTEYRMGALPFVFKMSDEAVDNLGIWRLEARGPKQIAAWMQGNKQIAPGVSDVDNGGFVAMLSDYHLVEGKPQG